MRNGGCTVQVSALEHTSTQQNPSNTYAVVGQSYNVCLTASNGNGSDIYCDSVAVADTSTSTSIKGITKPRLIVYPYMAQKEITISSEYELEEISIHNAIGKSIMELKPYQKTVSVNISHLPNGIYFIYAITGGITTYNKVLVAK